MIYVLVCVLDDCVEEIKAYSTLEKLQRENFQDIASELNLEDPLTGDFTTDWETLVEAMGESDNSYYIATCNVDGETTEVI